MVNSKSAFLLLPALAWAAFAVWMLIALAGLLTDMRAEAPELSGSIIPAALGGTAVLAAVVLLPAGVAAHWGICTLRGTAWNMRRALACSALATALHLLAATALAGAFCL